VAETVYEGKIGGAFYGFNGEMLFKMANGTYWIQAKYKYWYHYKYRPAAVITRESGNYVLTVEGHSIPVRRVTDVVESQIDGEFEGWQGESVYRLVNGQVWEQAAYKYEYHYAYRPEALVYPSSEGYKMVVDGTEAVVRRRS